MARAFNGAGNYIHAVLDTSAPNTLTLAVLASHNSLATTGAVWGLARGTNDLGNTERSTSIYFRGDTAGDPVQLRSVNNGNTLVTNSAAAYSINTITSIIVIANGANGTIFRDGVKTTSSGASAQLNYNRIVIGGLHLFDGTVDAGPVGDICFCAAWSSALTDDECASLHKRFAPRRIRPQSLLYYLPLVREVQDARSGLAYTTTGTVNAATHPRAYGF